MSHNLLVPYRYITWRMVRLRYIVEMQNEILGSFLMLLLQFQGKTFFIIIYIIYILLYVRDFLRNLLFTIDPEYTSFVQNKIV